MYLKTQGRQLACWDISLNPLNLIYCDHETDACQDGGYRG